MPHREVCPWLEVWIEGQYIHSVIAHRTSIDWSSGTGKGTIELDLPIIMDTGIGDAVEWFATPQTVRLASHGDRVVYTAEACKLVGERINSTAASAKVVLTLIVSSQKIRRTVTP